MIWKMTHIKIQVVQVESQNYLPPMTLTSQERPHHMSNDYHISMPNTRKSIQKL